MMTTFKLCVYVGLLLGMLLPVLALALTDPTLPSIAVAGIFLLLMVPLIRKAIQLHRERGS